MIKKEDYRSYYERGRRLGDAPFGDIFEGKDKKSKKDKAIKIFDKKRVKKYLIGRGISSIDREMNIYFNAFRDEAKYMRTLQGKNNENAVSLDECFETDEEFVIIMEKCDNNLFKHLISIKKTPFNPDEIYEILKQLNNSFEIMVNNKIIHRALKPQNILLKYLNEEKSKFLVKLKITYDSCFLDDSSTDSSNFLSSDIGMNYKIYAPEVLKGEKYTEESDLWSIGILIYLLYFKEYPFKGNSKEEILKNITEDEINKLKKGENTDLNNLIRELLIIEPNRRITWEEYFNHPFFRKKMDFRKFYTYDEDQPLGQSEYGIIYQGKDLKTGQKKAIKIMDKGRIRSQLEEHFDPPREATEEDLKPIIDGFFNEVNHMIILQGLNNENQNTVIFDEYFNTDEEFVIIMELCNDNLLQYKSEVKKNILNFEEIDDLISQLNNSFEIMVKNKILHGALKSENILMKYENEQKSKYLVKLKLTDDSELLDSSSSLINYNKIYNNLKIYAPEVINGGKYTEKSDLFSLGVLIYFLYFNKFPFEGETKEEILGNIKKGIPNELTKNSDFNDLLKKLLNENEEERISWKDYFNHKFFRINQNFTKYFEILKGKDGKEERLGASGHGIIYKAKDKKTGQQKAIKIMDKRRIRNKLEENFDIPREATDEDLKPIIDGFFNEVNHMKILQGINNENKNNTVIFEEYFNNYDYFVIVMELCNDNLYNYIKKKSNFLKFEEIQQILIQLNNSFRIMVKNKILHRALKPENILVKTEENSKILYKLKLTEYSCLLHESKRIDLDHTIFSENLCIYAPEVLNGEKYTEKSDLWSLGITIYFLFNKVYPFSGKNKKEILNNIKRGLSKKISENSDFNDLINKLLEVDPKKRMSWKEYFKHPFLINKI